MEDSTNPRHAHTGLLPPLWGRFSGIGGSGAMTAERGPEPEGEVDRECLGRHASLAAFACEVVTPLVRPEGRWLLDCLDLVKVLELLAGEDRLWWAQGRVYLERRAV